MATIKQLQHVTAVLESKTLHRAAQSLHITQPALTRSIMSLEEELGVKLFERSRNGMQPTEFCGQIQGRCSQLSLELQDLKRDAELYRNIESGRLTIGLGLTTKDLILNGPVFEFVKHYPRLKIRLREASPDDLLHELENRSLDLLLVDSGSYHQSQNIRVEALCSVAMRMFTRQGHPLTKIKKLSLSQVLEYPLLATSVLSEIHPLRIEMEKHLHGIALEPQVVCSSYETLLDITKATDSCVVTIESVAKDAVAKGLLQRIDPKGWDLNVELSAVELSNRPRSPAAEKFIDGCRRAMPSHL